MKSRRNEVCIVWIRIQLAYLSNNRGAVGLYRQSKVHPPTTLLADIDLGMCIEQWNSGSHRAKYSGPCSGFPPRCSPAARADILIAYTI